MGVVISRAASAVKGRVPLCLCIAAFALTSCGGSGFDEPADPLTPDVTSFGIRPVAQLVDPQGDTYLMRYSRDNRLVSLDGAGRWSMGANPLVFYLNGEPDITDIVLDAYGCAVSFNEQKNGGMHDEYSFEYDAEHRLVCIKARRAWSGGEVLTKVRRGECGRVESVTSVFNGDVSEVINYAYFDDRLANGDGLFVEGVTVWPFLEFAGLLGRPSGELPLGYSVYSGGELLYTGEYSYYVSSGGIVSKYAETVHIDGITETYVSSITYAGLYLK